MNILITGGAGFIGSHTVDLLVNSGHRVTVYDNLSTGSPHNLRRSAERCTFVEGDVRDLRKLAAVVRQGKFEGILHLAAVASVTKGLLFPGTTEAINVGGTINVLEVARKYGVRRVAFASSAAVYGDPQRVPCAETAPPAPMSQYGIHKLSGEMYARVYSEMYRLETVCLRYFNVYGPRQDAASPYSGVITRFLSLLQRGEKPTINGDGKQTRDFVYVKDLAAVNIAALFKDGVSHAVLNVGTGRVTTIVDLYRQLCQLQGVPAEMAFGPARQGDIRHSRADVTQLGRVLGSVPNTSLTVGLGLSMKAMLEEMGERIEVTEPVPVGKLTLMPSR